MKNNSEYHPCDDHSGVLDIRLLGPVEIIVRDTSLKMKRRKQRLLLALLSLNPRRAVGVDTIIDNLWQEPPVGVRNQIQIHVSAIRTTLADNGLPRDTLQTLEHGYRLNLPPGTTDIEKVEVAAAAAEVAIAEERFAAAIHHLQTALDRWRSTPLVDITEDFARVAAVSLDERRRSLFERKLDLQLALGHYSEALAELFGEVRGHNLNEEMHLRLMIALHGCGRSADALHVYQRVRRALVESTGMEPGTRLRHAQTAILRGEEPRNIRSALLPLRTAGVKRPSLMSTASR